MTPKEKLIQIRKDGPHSTFRDYCDTCWLISRVIQLEQALETLQVAVNDKVSDPGAVNFILKALGEMPEGWISMERV